MAEVSHRKVGAVLADTQKFHKEAVEPALKQLLHNEQVTQKKIANLEAFAEMSFGQRLRWFFRGAR